MNKNVSKKLHTQKNRPSGAPGPARTSPWRAKRGTLPKLSTFLSQLKGDPLEKKQIFEKKSHNAEKLKGGTLWGFSTSILSQNIKILKGGKFLFSEKNLTVPKKTVKGDPLGFSKIHFDAKQQKLKGGSFGEKCFSKKSLAVPKKMKGGPFGLARYGMLRGKAGKTFLVKFA